MKIETKMFLESTFRSARRDISFDVILESAYRLFEGLDTARSLGIYLRLKYREYSQYLEMEIDPLDYVDPDTFHSDYQCAKLLSKAEFFPRIYDTRKNAELSFIQSEIECLKVNNRFYNRVDLFRENPAESSILFTAMHKISAILGDCPNLSDLDLSFGPGNNVELKNNTSVVDKLDSTLTLTSNLVDKLPEILASIPGWAAYVAGNRYIPTPRCDSFKAPVSVVVGSQLGFVPKNAKTDRAICTEPLVNSIVQLGIGKYMRNRLRMSGCNLNSQSRNQFLARIGSKRGHLATVDLKAASDTIAYAVVHELLPAPWFDLLDACRSPRFSYQGKCYNFSKFSSMGNGYTFELESLIFLALARSVCEYEGISKRDVSVYGDDIIIPVKAYDRLQKVLSFCGFTVNESKSFKHGPFRESCGEDWFLGAPVRPLFLKRRPTNATLIGWCNHIMRKTDYLIDHRYKAFYDSLKSLVPKAYYRLEGPNGYGDGHFVVKYENIRSLKSNYLRRGWEGKAYYTLSTSPLSYRAPDHTAYLACLYDISKSAVDWKNPSDVGSTHNMKYYHFRRDRTRTVLRRAFHPETQ